MVRISAIRSLALAAAVLFFPLLLAGCGSSGRDLTVDKGVARTSLTTFLDSWKEGKAVDSLTSASPSITGRDTDWDNGKKLTSYTIAAEEFEDGSNVHLTADLTLEGESTPKKVTYVVSTTPAITIFRRDD